METYFDENKPSVIIGAARAYTAAGQARARVFQAAVEGIDGMGSFLPSFRHVVVVAMPLSWNVVFVRTYLRGWK